MLATPTRKNTNNENRVRRKKPVAPIRVIIKPTTKSDTFLDELVSDRTSKINEAAMQKLLAYLIAEAYGSPRSFEKYEAKAASIWANLAFVIRQGLIKGYSFNIPGTGMITTIVQKPRERYDPNKRRVGMVNSRRSVRFRTHRPFWLELNDRG